MKVNKKALADVFGVSEVTLTTWQGEGLPIEHRGAQGTENIYDTGEVIEWYARRAVMKAGKAETQRDRLARLQADILEREIAERDKVLVPFDQVEPVWRNRARAACAFLRSRASRLAGMLEAAPGIEAKRRLLSTEDEVFLNHLGVDGARMQSEIDALLEKLSTAEADAFLKRISGH
jgi:phage terminase Nu1 subunit (DNA packaging protein)